MNSSEAFGKIVVLLSPLLLRGKTHEVMPKVREILEKLEFDAECKGYERAQATVNDWIGDTRREI